jgi:bifunctional non-homologous end joining protein LigD
LAARRKNALGIKARHGPASSSRPWHRPLKGSRTARAGSTKSSSTATGVQVHIHDGQVKVFTRRGNDWTKRFRKIAADASEVDAGSAILDGEVVVPSASGVSDFSVLQNELKGRSTKIVLVVFDLLYLNGHDLRKLPLLARNAELKQIIDGTAVQFSDSFEIDGQEMYQHACKLGLEGGVSKVRESAYVSGRGNIWVKKTCQQRETLTIAGFALDGQKWDGIYLDRRKGKDTHLCRQGRPRL